MQVVLDTALQYIVKTVYAFDHTMDLWSIKQEYKTMAVLVFAFLAATLVFFFLEFSVWMFEFLCRYWRNMGEKTAKKIVDAEVDECKKSIIKKPRILESRRLKRRFPVSNFKMCRATTISKN